MGGLGLLTCGVESCKREQVGAFEKKAGEAKGRADANAGTAGAADARAKAREGDLAQAESRVARLQVELERLRHRPVEVRPTLPEAPTPTPMAPVEDLVPLVAKQDELIQAQALQIHGLKAQVLDLTTGRDHWKEAFRAERDRALSLELALEAQKAVARASLWKGRIQGLAVGFAAGYVVDHTRR
jgi:small-conductance mechanosensitive channel